MCKEIADRMLTYLPKSSRLRTEPRLIYWENFYRNAAEGYVAMALAAERANMPSFPPDMFLDHARSCELAARIVHKLLATQQQSG